MTAKIVNIFGDTCELTFQYTDGEGEKYGGSAEIAYLQSNVLEIRYELITHLMNDGCEVEEIIQFKLGCSDG